jgi:hypothetical protein
MAWVFHKKGLRKMKVAFICFGTAMFLTLPAAVTHLSAYVFVEEIPYRHYILLHNLGDAFLLGAIACAVGGGIMAIWHIFEDIKKDIKVWRAQRALSPQERKKLYAEKALSPQERKKLYAEKALSPQERKKPYRELYRELRIPIIIFLIFLILSRIASRLLW